MASGTIKAVIGRSDIVNNLTTNDSTKVLSAAQGYALNSKVAHYGEQYITNVSSSNIGSITDTGTYIAYFESSVVPVAGWGTIDVVNTTGTITQIITTQNVHKFRRYVRNTSTWTDWTEFALNSKTSPVIDGLYLPSGVTSCDQLTTTGTYSINGSAISQLTDEPDSSAAILFVNASMNNYINQKWVSLNGEKIFERCRNYDMIWSGWQQLALNSNIAPYQTGCVILQIEMPDSSGPRIINGKKFTTRIRQSILALYSDQNGNTVLFSIYVGSSSWDPTVNIIFKSATYNPTITPTIVGDDILLSGLSNWGRGYAMGQFS